MNPSRFHLAKFVERAAKSAAPGALVLDAGSGDAPYKHLFSHTRYESCDFCRVDKPYDLPTYTCDIESIPVEDCRYDLVVLTQVLEHLSNPLGALRELHRVTKSNGRLWLSCPFYYQEHEQPYDFFRYTQFGLRHLVSQAGFRVDELEWLEGYSAAASHQLAMAYRELPRSIRAYGGGWKGTATLGLVEIGRPWLRLVAFALSRADTRMKWTASGQCKNYAVVAIKAEPTEDEAARLVSGVAEMAPI